MKILSQKLILDFSSVRLLNLATFEPERLKIWWYWFLNFIMKTSYIQEHLCMSHIFEMFSIKCNKLDVHIRLSQKESAPYIWTYIWSIFASSMWGGPIMSRGTQFFSSFLLSLWSRLAIYYIWVKIWLLKLFPGKEQGFQIPEKMGKWDEGEGLILAPPPENKYETSNPGFFFIFQLTALYTVTKK